MLFLEKVKGDRVMNKYIDENTSNKMMSFEAKKIYLKRYQRTRSKIDRLQSRIDDLKTDDLSDDDCIFLSETKERIKAIEKDSQVIRKEIYATIDKLDNYHEIEVLEMFFIFNYDFERIAEEKCYSIRHVIRTYSRAIRNLELL